MNSLQDLIGRVLAGDRAALARGITLIERDAEAARVIDAAIAPHRAQGYAIGITGAPGAGKSTLLGAMLERARAADRRVAVLALDPVSPLTQGAILGDRLRMEHAAGDARIFLRSMTADAHGGGLAVITPLVIRLLAAAGWPLIAIETVGVGQTELDIVEAAATTIVVLNPGWGDEVQAVKAGLMEVADIFVINKADRDGVEQTRQDLQRLIKPGAQGDWQTPILETVAHRDQGVGEVWSAIDRHREFQTRTGLLAARRKRFVALAVKNLAMRNLGSRLEALALQSAYAGLIEASDRGELSVHAAAERLLDLLAFGPLERT